MVRFEVACDLPFSREDFWRIRTTPTFLRFIVTDGLLKKINATRIAVDEDGWSSREQSYIPTNVDCPAVVRSVVGNTLFGVTDMQRWNDEQEPFVQQFNIRPTFLSGISKTSGRLTLEPSQDKPTLTSTHDNDSQAEDGSSVTDSNDGGDRDIDTGSASESEDAGRADDSEQPEQETQDPNSSVTPQETDTSPSSTTDQVTADLMMKKLPPSEKCRHTVRGEVRVSILTVGWFVERSIVHNLRLFYKDYPDTIARFRDLLIAKYADAEPDRPMADIINAYMLDEETEWDAFHAEVENETEQGDDKVDDAL